MKREKNGGTFLSAGTRQIRGGKMRHAGVVCAAALLLLLLGLCHGCSCPVRHPQQHFCEADFVANVKVRRTVTLPDGQTVLRVRVRRMLKGSPKAVMALSSGLIYTVPGTCSVNVTHRAMHVVTGEIQAGKPWTSACHFTAPWPSLAPKMKKGFRLLYSTACDCPIMSCHWWERSCPASPFFCPWKTSTHSEDCQARHSVCLRNPSGGCRWVGGRLLRGCMKRWRSGLVRTGPAGAGGAAGTAGTDVTDGTGRTEWRNVASLVPPSGDVATAPEDAHDPIISNDVVDDLPSHRGGVWVHQPRPQSPRYDKPRKFDPRRPYIRHHKPTKPVKPSHFGETPLQLGEKPSQLGEILLSQTSPKVEMIAAPVSFNSSGGASDHHESPLLHPVVHGHDATARNQSLVTHATSGSQPQTRTHSRLSSDPATRSRLSGVRPPKSSDLEDSNEEVTEVPPEPYLRLLRYPEYTTQIGTFDHD